MLKDISSINIEGAKYNSLTQLSLFDPADGKDKNGATNYKNVKGCVLYGRNGTGKSTIAKSFRKVKGEVISSIKQAYFCDKDNKPIAISDVEKKQIYVFDEDYVNSHVKLKEDHLDTIIMLGKAADLAEKLAEAENDYKSAKSKFDKKEAELKEFQDCGNPKSPEYYIDKMASVLRGDDAWAGRDRKANDGRMNTPVNKETYKRFISLKPSKTRSELIVDFDEGLKTLESAVSGTSIIVQSVPLLPELYEHYDENTILELLNRKLEKPELSEREQFLLGLVEKGEGEELVHKLTFFRDTAIKECPFCYQTIGTEYRESLITSIEKVLSKEVENHLSDLRLHHTECISIDISLFTALGNYKKCKDLIDLLNSSIKNNNDLLNQKIENPFNVIVGRDNHFSDNVHDLIGSLKELENERVEYNSLYADPKTIVEKLNEINSHIAYYDIKDLASDYDKQKLEYEKVINEFKSANDDLNEKIKVVADLESQRKNVSLAIENINACLKYIFFSDDRLKIVYSAGEYHLLSNGQSVRPCDISVGERNIIGLSYFFTSILEGQDETTAYGKEYLLVIDDPVSSFDYENKIGILSFLKYKLGLFLEGHEYSRALVMTHDLMSFFDVCKVLEEIVSSCDSSKSYALPPKYNRYELSRDKIVHFINRRHEYTELLKILFVYGQGSSSDNDLVIGNIMRQVLEAFSTFQYKKGIEDVSTDPEILALLQEPEYQTYYKNLMYRLVLHGGSHREEQIKAMSDYDFFSLISETEKQRTAKDVLCFIYLLNKQHVLNHLQGVSNAEAILNVWCGEVKSRAAVP